MKLIDGKKIAQEIRAELKKEIAENSLTPGLAIIKVGDNPASEIYVRNKLKACEEIGIKGKLYQFESNISEEELIKCINDLNDDTSIHGIIVQSPLPNQFNEDIIMNSVDAEKDVDGFGLISLGCLISNQTNYLAATPYGIIKMLEHENITITGKNVVIVGRSKIVGRPLALALINKNATVTITHSKTNNLSDFTKKADILIVAIGKSKFITSEYVKDGAIIIDVGINRVDGHIYGDVDLESIKDKVALASPVPGGVGPMTIAMLLANVVESAKRKENKEWTRKLEKH